MPIDFLASLTVDTEWAAMHGKHGILSKVKNMKAQLDEKDSEISELDNCLQLATNSIRSFHAQQRELFDDFIQLREKYDSMKVKLRDVLWGHVASTSHEFAAIPRLQHNLKDDGDKIEQYELGELVGKGEFAHVRTCTVASATGSASKVFAVKILAKEKIVDVAGLQRTANEIRILREANHPNILKIYDIIHTQERLYIIMEKGTRDLFDYLMSFNRRQWARAEEFNLITNFRRPGISSCDQRLSQRLEA